MAGTIVNTDYIIITHQESEPSSPITIKEFCQPNNFIIRKRIYKYLSYNARHRQQSHASTQLFPWYFSLIIITTSFLQLSF